jgi:hypothetical protein
MSGTCSRAGHIIPQAFRGIARVDITKRRLIVSESWGVLGLHPVSGARTGRRALLRRTGAPSSNDCSFSASHIIHGAHFIYFFWQTCRAFLSACVARLAKFPPTLRTEAHEPRKKGRPGDKAARGECALRVGQGRDDQNARSAKFIHLILHCPLTAVKSKDK